MNDVPTVSADLAQVARSKAQAYQEAKGGINNALEWLDGTKDPIT